MTCWEKIVGDPTYDWDQEECVISSELYSIFVFTRSPMPSVTICCDTCMSFQAKFLIECTAVGKRMCKTLLENAMAKDTSAKWDPGRP